MPAEGSAKLRPYIDTSALAKRYLNEPYSDDLDAYLSEFSWVSVSTLTEVEMFCLLSRRRRYGELTSEQEDAVRNAFREDIENGDLRVVPVADEHLRMAIRLVDELDAHALRTLDALHLAVVRTAGCEALATADLKMADAAHALGVSVERFV